MGVMENDCFGELKQRRKKKKIASSTILGSLLQFPSFPPPPLFLRCFLFATTGSSRTPRLHFFTCNIPFLIHPMGLPPSFPPSSFVWDSPAFFSFPCFRPSLSFCFSSLSFLLFLLNVLDDDSNFDAGGGGGRKEGGRGGQVWEGLLLLLLLPTTTEVEAWRQAGLRQLLSWELSIEYYSIGERRESGRGRGSERASRPATSGEKGGRGGGGVGE